MTDSQVKSKRRVAQYGEVLTSKEVVDAMLDLVKSETERIDSRFLEPACGTGNFLTEILERKLRVVESRYARSQLEYERYAVLTVSSSYGIDILEDNVQECRNRLFNFMSPVITIPQAQRFLGVTYPAAKRNVDKLVDAGILFPDAESSYGKTFTAREILNIIAAELGR